MGEMRGGCGSGWVRMGERQGRGRGWWGWGGSEGEWEGGWVDGKTPRSLRSQRGKWVGEKWLEAGYRVGD